MGRLIALGIFMLFMLGIPVKCMLDNMISSPGTGFQVGTTADRFIAAQKEGQAIPQRPTGDGREQSQGRPDSREDCTAANLHPTTHPPMTGTVIRVVDGDTMIVRVEGTEMRIRLWGIDAPEKDQAGGPEAQRNLEGLTPPGSRAMIHPLSMDRYGRVVGNVGKESEWAVNFRMVAQGWAYHYREYDARNSPCLLEAEQVARDYGMGLWKGGEIGGIRPWEHRRSR